MNITVEDILARLTAGETVDEIADKFTSVLNDAIRRDEENKKEAERIAKEKELKTKKQNCILDVVYALSDLCIAYNETDLAKTLIVEAENDIDNICLTVDNLFSQLNSVKSLFGNDFVKALTPATKSATKKETVKSNPQASIFKFLETNGLL
jgi:hypothetical protein